MPCREHAQFVNILVRLGNLVDNFLQSLKNLSPARLVSIAAVILFLVSFFIYIATQLGSSDYAVLYTDLELEDAKQIVTQLDSQKIKYRLTKNGTEVLVPKDMVNKMRVETADLALSSSGSNVGYEIFDNSDALGSTNFVQNVNLIRALEGELSRTIRSVDNIKTARVHLVLPKREMFSKEEQKPSASVVVKTKSGKLNPHQIHSIQKLVAAAVPKLDVKSVAIVDSAGNLLTNNYEDEETLSNANNEVLRQDQERKLAAKVQNLLEKTIGEGKVRAQVSIEMDFDQVVTNEEIYDPDSQVVRSQSTVSEESETNPNEGQVTVANNIPNADAYAGGGGASASNSRTEETINYEISRVVRNKVRNSGIIQRMSVAVMVDGVYDKDEDGKETYRNRTEPEMDQIRQLVRSAVGFDANRGDLVEVENMRFIASNHNMDTSTEKLILGFSKEELIRIAEGLGVAIVAILVILLVIRPLISNAFDSTKVSEGKLVSEAESDDNLLLSSFLNDEEGDVEDLININKVDGRVKASSIKRVNDIVEKNPDATVNIIRTWLYQNEGNS